MVTHSWVAWALVAFLLQGTVCPLLCTGADARVATAREPMADSPCHAVPALPDREDRETDPGCAHCVESQTATVGSAPVAAPALFAVPAPSPQVDAMARAEQRLAALPTPPGSPPHDLLLLKSTLLI